MVREARSIWKTYDRPNIMIKIPATIPGVEAFKQLITEGINVNVTLIFTLSRYRKVIDAYFTGLEMRLGAGNPIDHVASVASFFVSRVDTKVDKKLQEISTSGNKTALEYLGQAAVANARLAYEIFTAEINSDRFKKLKAAGAQIQRPLWASTGTKNPAYSDVLYVDELIGADTVNTVPPATLTNFVDHGNVAVTIDRHLDEAHLLIQKLEKRGISLEEIGNDLEKEGVTIFADAYNQLQGSIDEKREEIQNRLGKLSQEVKLRVDVLSSARAVHRLYDRDATLWTEDSKSYNEIERRLGWLNLPTKSKKMIKEIYQLREEVLKAGYKFIFLLGMGGSSLAPEVYNLVFGSKTGLELVIVDSTDPDQIRKLTRSKPLEASLFIVSSKSGGTSEIIAFLEYFWQKCKKVCGHGIGDHFVAITDPGTSLEHTALSRNFRKIFLSDPDVGGRYSALTAFGLLPAGLLGIDLDELLNKAASMADQCVPAITAGRNPGLVLGAIMGQAALSGKDKISLLTDKSIRPFADWLEQLIAESSGKSGVGILPVVEEFLLPVKYLGSDRLTVYLRLDGSFDAHIRKLVGAGLPVVVINLRQPEDLFAEFFRWEFAIAIACSIIRVNAFDQPDVQDNKNRTVIKMNELKDKGRLIEPPVVWENSEIQIYSSDGKKFNDLSSLKEVVDLFLAGGQKGDYVAINSYLPYEKQTIKALTTLRRSIQIKTGFTTTRGFGPRFLHSTGQLHKGGTSNGLFIQITRNPEKDLKYGDLSFGNLERAQALGDYESLLSRGRKIIRIHIKNGAVSEILKDIV
jgi:transaldolase/glucose-6-phosphate isomerase